jgi:phosphate transport system substrate-binding protein
MASLENQYGQDFIAPSPTSGAAALEDVTIPENLRLFVFDPPAKNAYPIVTCTWILCNQTYANEVHGRTLKEVLRYCLSDNGQAVAGDLGYIPLPKELQKLALAKVDEIN